MLMVNKIHAAALAERIFSTEISLQHCLQFSSLEGFEHKFSRTKWTSMNLVWNTINYKDLVGCTKWYFPRNHVNIFFSKNQLRVSNTVQ